MFFISQNRNLQNILQFYHIAKTKPRQNCEQVVLHDKTSELQFFNLIAEMGFNVYMLRRHKYIFFLLNKINNYKNLYWSSTAALS